VLLLGDIVRRHARYRGGRTAFVLDHADGRLERVTYAALDAGANRLAHVLLDLGVRRGDRVAILAHNCVEYPWTYFACCKLGAIVVPINTRNKRAEIRQAIALAEPRVLLVGADFAGGVAALRRDGEISTVERILLIDGPPGGAGDAGTPGDAGARPPAEPLAPLLAAASATETIRGRTCRACRKRCGRCRCQCRPSPTWCAPSATAPSRSPS